MRRVIHAVTIKAPRHGVYEALATRGGLAQWWTTDVTGDAVPGGTLALRFADVFKPDMQVVALDRDTAVRWRCVGGEQAWLDNAFSFDLTDDNGLTLLMFRQEYARELDDRAYGSFNYNWGHYLTSLKTLCETGTGAPFEQTAQRS